MERPFVGQLRKRLREKRPLIQMVMGPRQVGKTTGVRQLLKKWPGPAHAVSADATVVAGPRWLQDQWQAALAKGPSTLLVVDEIQKVHRWSDIVKALWDDRPHALKCVFLGSSALDLQRGLTESLVGRFELIKVPHWSFLEFKKGFRCGLDAYLLYGGYPGSYAFIKDKERWREYMASSIINRVIGVDILSQRSVAKPALFRQAFEILCGYPAQEVSYVKLLGQLQDKGNIDLVKQYIDLYEGAFLFSTIPKYSPKPLVVKGSSPKILPLCPALVTLAMGEDFAREPENLGRLFESMVGVDLLRVGRGKVAYWRERDNEVDFVFSLDNQLFAIEVKSGRKKPSRGYDQFKKICPQSRFCVVNRENYETFSKDPVEFLSSQSLSA